MSSAFRRNFCKTRYNSPRLARVARIHNFMAGSNAFLHPATRRPPLSSSSRTCTAASLLLSVGRMNTAPTQLTLDITALSHDGRGIARLAPADDHASKGTVVFVANALPGQRVNASVLRRKTSFIDAEASTLLSQSPDAVDPICPHHAECGGCPLQTMPYAQQLYWKRTLAVDALTRIGKF
jgi:SAM-dependent methyltransferases related to tRNA (uracil-5-)-methyltransferase